MEPPDFSRVALATAFSPRFLPGLAEAWHFASRFQATFSIVHVGECTVEKETILAEAMEHLQVPSATPMLWRTGDPVDELVQSTGEEAVELLVAGALIRGREVNGRHFLGTVARGLLKRSACSLLLLTKPQVESRLYRRIAMVTDFTEGARNAFRAALALAERDQAECLHVIAIRSPFAGARSALEGNGGAVEDREALLDEFAQIAKNSPVPLKPRVINSATGVSAANFIATVGADLLVVPTAASHEPVLLPQNMDWVSQAISCDLWVVKKHSAPVFDHLHRSNSGRRALGLEQVVKSGNPGASQNHTALVNGVNR
jgi:nucleotide-binding universal stress UspA family protein